jgi:uncharacterized lipoprotein YmbA
MKTIATTLITALGAIFLSGCPSFEPVADSTRYYTLTTVDESGLPGAVPAADAPLVGVRVTQLAAHLKRPAMTVRLSEHELEFAEEHRWAERLDDAAGRMLAIGIQRQVGSRMAVAATSAARAATCGQVVEIDLLACEGRAGSDGSAVLVADWRVVRGADRSVLSSGRFRSEKPGWDGKDYAQLAELLRGAVDELAEMLAKQVMAAAGAG